MTVYKLDKLTETARCNLISGKLEVYDVEYKHLVQRAKTTIQCYRWSGRSVVFSYGGRNKILVYNN